MALSYHDISIPDTKGVVLEGLDPSFFIAVPYSTQQDSEGQETRQYQFEAAIHLTGTQLTSITTQLDFTTSASGAALPNGTYRVFRCTPYNAMLHNFIAGSRFDLRTYQRNWTQLLHLYQEIVEGRLVIELVGTSSYPQQPLLTFESSVQQHIRGLEAEVQQLKNRLRELGVST